MQVLEFNTKVLRPGKSWKKALVLESAGKSLTFERDVDCSSLESCHDAVTQLDQSLFSEMGRIALDVRQVHS